MNSQIITTVSATYPCRVGPTETRPAGFKRGRPEHKHLHFKSIVVSNLNTYLSVFVSRRVTEEVYRQEAGPFSIYANMTIAPLRPLVHGLSST